MKTTFKALALIVTLGLASAAQALPRGQTVCTIRAYDGHFLTAVGGGGRTNDVIHTNATSANAWEMFRFYDSQEGGREVKYGIRTSGGFYLTAVSGGGRANDAIHSDARYIKDWEKFTVIPVGNGYHAIRTIKGYYLTAQDSGGRVTDVIHTNATRIGNWEKFRINCRR